MNNADGLPFFVSIPHSGEKIPDEVTWLKGLTEATLMRDVDRYVDVLYQPALNELKIPSIVTPWHRYVVDLNRKPDQFDCDAVVDAPLPAGAEPKGLHWSVTTWNEKLIAEPMTMELHDRLLRDYYHPFHTSVLELRKGLKDKFGVVYHLDLHSMPSRGTSLHPDPGETRAEVVVSDQHGKSASPAYKDLVMRAFQEAGFQVAYNWPYVGGGITKTYGDPDKEFHTIQIELNRSQYMDEDTKQLNQSLLPGIQAQLKQAISTVQNGIKELTNV